MTSMMCNQEATGMLACLSCCIGFKDSLRVGYAWALVQNTAEAVVKQTTRITSARGLARGHNMLGRRSVQFECKQPPSILNVADPVSLYKSYLGSRVMCQGHSV